MAKAVTANCCCLAKGKSTVCSSQSHSWAFSRRRASFSRRSFSRVGPPLCSASTAAMTSWAWLYTHWRLQPDCWACSVTAPWGPVRHAAALAIQRTNGMVRMGMGPLGCGSVSNRTLEVHPPKESRGNWLNLATCQLENAVIGHFWDDPSRRDPTALLDPVDERLDQITILVSVAVIVALRLPVRSRRNHRPCPGGLDRADQLIAVIALVRDHMTGTDPG